MRWIRSLRSQLVRVDCVLFERVARAHVPALDRALPLLSRSANQSNLWIVVAGAFAAGGGRRGQRAAIRGIGSIVVSSLLVNQGLKRIVKRPRPALRNVPIARRVRVPPLTTSFPSGHAASAAAFATGVSIEQPAAAPPLALIAGAVALSRVYVGVHYPFDVLAGAGIGATVAAATRRLWPALPPRADAEPPSDDRRRIPAKPDGDGVRIVVNPSSGSASDGLVEWLHEHLPRARVDQLGEDDDLPRRLDEAARAAEVLGVAGGDGTVAAAAQVALEREEPLLALPGGTLNHLARDLRIKRARDAVEALAAGEAVGIDLGTIDGRLFINSAGFGAYAEMLAKTDELRIVMGRWPAQTIALLRTLTRAQPLEAEIEGEWRSVWLGFVGNCRYEPAGLAPSWRPRLDDGMFDVRILSAELRFSRIRALVAAFSGRLERSKVYQRVLVRDLRVRSPRERLPLAQDGEHFDGSGSFSIEKLPEHLVVCARHEPGRRARGTAGAAGPKRG